MTADFGAVCGSCDMLENLDHCFGHRDVKSPGDATQTYDKGIKVKESAYLKSGLDVIPVYPWMFSEDWRGYLMRELKRRTIRSYRSLPTKPYIRCPIRNYQRRG
jgi:hypothetical protein